MPDASRELFPIRVKYYIGIRGDHRITLIVDGLVDADGAERISAEDARAVEAVMLGADYHVFPNYLEEPPACSTEAPQPPRFASTEYTGTPLFANSL